MGREFSAPAKDEPTEAELEWRGRPMSFFTACEISRAISLGGQVQSRPADADIISRMFRFACISRGFVT
jgi:hypothetical protein